MTVTAFTLATTSPAVLAAESPSPSPSASPSSSPPASDPNRATFGVQPASASARDSRPYLSYAATPGASFDDHVAIVNHSLSPLTLTVYATDALNTDAGGFSLLAGDAPPKDAGSWITVGTGGVQTVTVPAQPNDDAQPGVVIVPVHITIPADGAPGDHTAGVLAALTSLSNDPKNPNVQLEQRIATRVYIRVSGPVHPGLKVDIVKVRQSDASSLDGGKVKITYRVRNVGNVNLGGRSHVSVTGLLGTKSTAAVIDFPLLLPGSSIELTALVKGVYPEVLETAKVSIQPLTRPSDVDPGLAKTYSGSRHFWAIPWILIAFILLLIVLGLYGLFYLRRRRAASKEATR